LRYFIGRRLSLHGDGVQFASILEQPQMLVGHAADDFWRGLTALRHHFSAP
jgi:hypothetical protein